MLADIVFWFLVFGLGMWLWIIRYRKLYVEHILRSISDAAHPLVMGYVIFSLVSMLLVSYHEITGSISPGFFAKPLVVTAYSMTANWFLLALLMATQARALDFFAKAFAKNTLVYPRKIFWGCLLLAAPLILALGALVFGFSFFMALAN